MNRYKKAEIQVDKFCQLVDDIKLRVNGQEVKKKVETVKHISAMAAVIGFASYLSKWAIK